MTSLVRTRVINILHKINKVKSFDPNIINDAFNDIINFMKENNELIDPMYIYDIDHLLFTMCVNEQHYIPEKILIYRNLLYILKNRKDFITHRIDKYKLKVLDRQMISNIKIVLDHF